MTRSKDPSLIAKIAILKANGATQGEIANQVGITRQTVAAYMQSPELQRAFKETQGALVSLVDTAIKRAIKDMKDKSPLSTGAKTAVEIIKAIGSKVITNSVKVSETRDVPLLSTEDRDAKMKEVEELLEGREEPEESKE